jgi:hypothetical protein
MICRGVSQICAAYVISLLWPHNTYSHCFVCKMEGADVPNKWLAFPSMSLGAHLSGWNLGGVCGSCARLVHALDLALRPRQPLAVRDNRHINPVPGVIGRRDAQRFSGLRASAHRGALKRFCNTRHGLQECHEHPQPARAYAVEPVEDKGASERCLVAEIKERSQMVWCFVQVSEGSVSSITFC